MNYSSDAIKLRLEVRVLQQTCDRDRLAEKCPGHRKMVLSYLLALVQGPAFAFSSIKVVLGGEAGEWDYVTLESPDGVQCACAWAPAISPFFLPLLVACVHAWRP